MVSTPVCIKISTEKLSRTSTQLQIKVSSENKEILTGDFNFNYQKVDDNGELKSIFTLFQLKQIIKTATKVTDKTGSLIDSVFTNVPFNITLNGIYALSFSDRDLIGFNRKQNRGQLLQKLFVVVITVDMTIASWKVILKMLIGHQCTSHIPFRTHHMGLIEHWLSFLIDTPRFLQKGQTLIYLHGWLLI